IRKRFYLGDVPFKGEILKGEQPAIVDRDLFDAVQARLTEQVNHHKAARMKSEALLSGRIFDDRGNRMTPSHARKGGVKYRYYMSSALLQGLAERAGTPPQHARPRRSETRALLVASIARGRRWLDEILADANANAESIAKRERCSARKVNMTISLAFLAPDLVKAAIEGRLPDGMGVARLADMSAEWSRQHQMLGLPSA